MLPKKHRLSKYADVQLATARGRSFFNKFFVIKSLANNKTSIPQWTVIVSAKVAKEAVKRNRIKRIIRNYLQSRLSLLKPGFYAVIVRKTAVIATPAEIREELAFSLQKSNILIG